MKKTMYIERIERIDLLIRLEATGPPCKLANKLNISRSTLLTFIKHLKEDLMFPILFCRHRNTYYYQEPGHFRFGFEKIRLDNSLTNQVKGGVGVNKLTHHRESNTPWYQKISSLASFIYSGTNY